MRNISKKLLVLLNAPRATEARCGSVIVSERNVIIGRGYNAPPLGDETQRTCDVEYHTDKKPKSDKTCCVHAEWNAIIDGLKNYPEEN